LRRSGLPNANLAADEIETSYQNNIPYQRELGNAISIGGSRKDKFFTDMFGESDTTRNRHAIRALALLRITRGILLLSDAGQAIQTWDGLGPTQVDNQLRAELNSTQRAPTIFDAVHWFGQSMVPNIGNFFQLQQAVQTDFLNRINTVGDATTRSVLEHALHRVGKLRWAATNPDIASSHKFKYWTQHDPDDVENLQMNCWEGTLYCAFQAGAITKEKCIELYRRYDQGDKAAITKLFGKQQAFTNDCPKMRGDILTWDPGGGEINHVAIYAGLYQNEFYAWHVLALNSGHRNYQGGGLAHLERVDYISAMYLGGCNVYITTPFWDPTSPTHTFYQGL
jgi:hypothetical protein